MATKKTIHQLQLAFGEGVTPENLVTEGKKTGKMSTLIAAGKD